MMEQDALPLMTVTELAPLLERREVSPVEVVEAHLARIEALDTKLNAYITVTASAARKAARRAEGAIFAGNYLGPWHGVPIAVKDLLDSQGIRTTYGSAIFATYVPKRDAITLARLTQAGAILLGKLNLHEFATGGDPYNPHYGLAHNPWKADASYSSGGSSGGSAVATAAGLASSHLTHPCNLTGMPAMVLPSGFSEHGLPLGLQIAGRPFAKATLFAVAHAYEQHAGWWRRQPALD